MRLGKWVRIALVLLLPVVAVLAYFVGLRLWAGYHRRAAEQALAQREFKEASLHLEKCLDVAPDDLEARLLAAQAARRRGDFDEARRHLHLFHQGHGSADAHDLEHRLICAQQGDLEQAKLLLAHCAEHPDAPDTPLMLEACIIGSADALEPTVTVAMTYGGGGPAEAYLRKVLEADDLWLRLRSGRADQAEGLVWRARLHSLANDPGKAKADVRQALELDPEHYDARFHLAILLIQEAPAEAADHFQALHDRRPKDDHVCFGLAIVRHSLGQLDRARELLDEMLATQPDNVSALLERGGVALDAEGPEEAESWYRRAFALAPNEPDVNFALASCLQKAGRADEAKEYKQRSSELEAKRQQRQDNLLLRKLYAGSR
jgi:tetratricopeptide (TPR) repeat protein